jgi:hypothetical protein
MLAQDLDDRFDGSYKLCWSGRHGEQQSFGEHVFVIVSPCGQPIILEIKAGSAAQSDNGLTKPYGAERHRLLPPMTKSNEALGQFFFVSRLSTAPKHPPKTKKPQTRSGVCGHWGHWGHRQ